MFQTIKEVQLGSEKDAKEAVAESLGTERKSVDVDTVMEEQRIDGIVTEKSVLDGDTPKPKTEGVVVMNLVHVMEHQEHMLGKTEGDNVEVEIPEEPLMVENKLDEIDDNATMLGTDAPIIKAERKKIVKSNNLLKGASLKKRLVNNLVSPRKQVGTKNEDIELELPRSW